MHVKFHKYLISDAAFIKQAIVIVMTDKQTDAQPTTFPVFANAAGEDTSL